MKSNYRTPFQWAGFCEMSNHCQESSLFQGNALAHLGRGLELQVSQYLQGGVPTPSREVEISTLYWALCLLASRLFQRDWTAWPTLWRKKVEIQGGKGRGNSGTSNHTLQLKRINCMPYRSLLAWNPLKIQSLPHLINLPPSCFGPISS